MGFIKKCGEISKLILFPFKMASNPRASARVGAVVRYRLVEAENILAVPPTGCNGTQPTSGKGNGC